MLSVIMLSEFAAINPQRVQTASFGDIRWAAALKTCVIHSEIEG